MISGVNNNSSVALNAGPDFDTETFLDQALGQQMSILQQSLLQERMTLSRFPGADAGTLAKLDRNVSTIGALNPLNPNATANALRYLAAPDLAAAFVDANPNATPRELADMARKHLLATYRDEGRGLTLDANYLQRNPDVAAAAAGSGMDPNLFGAFHYLKSGRFEGRAASA